MDRATTYRDDVRPGRFLIPESISQFFDRIVQRYALPRVRFHDVRLTHALVGASRASELGLADRLTVTKLEQPNLFESLGTQTGQTPRRAGLGDAGDLRER